MRMFGNLLLTGILATAGVALACAPAAFAARSESDCQCLSGGAKDESKRAEAVFVGTVVSSHREISPAGEEWRVRLKVEDYWKGDLDEEQIVYTRDACAYSFEAGRRYLVFARRQEGRGRLITDVCMKTAPADAAAEDLAKLGRPKQRPRGEQ